MGNRGRDDRSIVPGPERARFAFVLGDCVIPGRTRELVLDAASGPTVGGEGRLPAAELPKKASSLAWFCAAPPPMLRDASRPSRDGDETIAWLSCSAFASAPPSEPAEPLRNCWAVARVGDVGGVVRSAALLASARKAQEPFQLESQFPEPAWLRESARLTSVAGEAELAA